jgi:hypothetical protein
MESILATPQLLAEFAQIDTRSLDYLPTRRDVVISLTSVPSRLNTLRLVLNGLLAQTVRGVAIELHIAASIRSTGDRWTTFPSWLRELRAINITEHAEDPGPMMKYLPALNMTVERLVIVVDDDVLYPSDLVQRLLDADQRWSYLAAICYRGWRIHRDLSWERSVLTPASNAEDVPIGIMTGHGAYCLRSNHLDLRNLNNLCSAPDDCWMMDDIWISGHLSQACTAKRLIAGSRRYKIPIASALGGHREERNDVALRWFSRDWTEWDLEPAEARTP